MDKAVKLHAAVDFALFGFSSFLAFHAQSYLNLMFEDASFYGSIVAFSVATFTISAFVCTMNYTGQNRLLDELVRIKGAIFRDRWTAVFGFQVLASVFPILLMAFSDDYSRITGAMAFGCLILAIIQVMRSLRLLLALMRVAEISNERDAAEQAEMALVKERESFMAEAIASRSHQK